MHSVVAVIADGALDKTALTDDVGSEEDLYEDFRSSNHRYGHPGGGGEQLAINEVRAAPCLTQHKDGCWWFLPATAKLIMAQGMGLQMSFTVGTIYSWVTTGAGPSIRALSLRQCRATGPEQVALLLGVFG